MSDKKNNKKNQMMVDGGMGLITGGTLFISYQLDVYFPLVCLILCGLCIISWSKKYDLYITSFL